MAILVLEPVAGLSVGQLHKNCFWARDSRTQTMGWIGYETLGLLAQTYNRLMILVLAFVTCVKDWFVRSDGWPPTPTLNESTHNSEALTDNNAVATSEPGPDPDHVRAARVKRLTKVPVRALVPRRTNWLPLPQGPDGRYIPPPAPSRSNVHKALMAAPTFTTDTDPIPLGVQFSTQPFRCISEATAHRKGFRDGHFGREVQGVRPCKYPLFGCEIKINDVVFKNCYVVPNGQVPPYTIVLSREDAMTWVGN